MLEALLPQPLDSVVRAGRVYRATDTKLHRDVAIKLLPLEDLTDRFRRAITPKTKVILVCHITNLTGQIFPVREICRMARERGIEAIVDGAHAFGHFPFTPRSSPTTSGTSAASSWSPSSTRSSRACA